MSIHLSFLRDDMNKSLAFSCYPEPPALTCTGSENINRVHVGLAKTLLFIVLLKWTTLPVLHMKHVYSPAPTKSLNPDLDL